MWKQGGRSSALDRAEALLSARRTSGGVGQPGPEGSLYGPSKTRSAPPRNNWAHEPGADADRSANVEIKHTRDGDPKQDLRPQSSLGGRSRFLKKAPPPTNSSQSPVSRKQKQTALEPQYVSTSQCDSQTAATSRQAEVESPSLRLVLEQAGQGTKVRTSELEDSPPPGVRFQSADTSGQLSARSSKQSQEGNRFLRKKAAGPAGGANAAPAAGVRSRSRSRSRAGNPLVSSGVNLESDEEDMRKLLGDSLDSSECSSSGAGRPSSTKRPDKMFSRGGHRAPSTAPPRSPASPSCRNSPFRFTGVAQAHFSPSLLSPSPSPPRISPSPPERLASSPEAQGPERSLSSSSGHGEVFSLEELAPAEPPSEGPHSQTASVSSEDFKINVRTLDQLVPATNGVPSEKAGTEKQTKEEEEEEDYQSDFESDASATPVSEHLRGDVDEDEALSEVRKEAFDPDRCHNRTDDDYSSVFSDQSCSSTSRTSDDSQRSKSFSRSRDSRSSRSRAGSTSFQQSRRRALKDVQVQTQPDPAGAATLDPTVRMIYMSPVPVVTRAVSGERLEDISSFNPAVFVVNEVLKQQLAMTRQFINSSQHLHRRLLLNLEPPNYRYTTLEETMQNIRKHRTPKLTMEDALEEVLQEMRDKPGSSARSRETAGSFT